ncbi:Ig-like domain-containing protein [Cohnella caldifontis]|uniref:Ig-like domain-containing protein n=1 Tax=Cohnella caldifontis TaxID=3027471 RepID=UPI0023EDACEF|nr:Ig-like domain-containing protein [Cohnella sp. YIM B05605]
MKRWMTALLAMLLFCGIAAPAAGAADLTTEQKFETLRQKGIFSGFSDGSAGLYQSMTREQFAQVLYKLLDLPDPVGKSSYSDVLRTRWSFQPVEAVTDAGLMVGTGYRKFSPESPVTVEQLAAVLVRSYGWTDGWNTFVSGKVSPWARASVAIALQNQLIPQMKDYTIEATRGLLVEAAYAVYEKSNGGKLYASSVTPISSQQIQVNLSRPVKTVDQTHFRLRDVYGLEYNVFAAVLSWDGLTVQVYTEPQFAGRSYSLYVDGIPWAFVAKSDDQAKPTVSSFTRVSDDTLELTFSEPVERTTATNRSNYTFNNGLKARGVQLSNDNRKVTVTTSNQDEGVKYRLYVQNVKDLNGNVMDDWSTEFSTDGKSPVASFKFNESTARITVSFSEKVNADAARNLDHYSFDKGLYPVKAELSGDGKTVTLTTSDQKDATVYTLTVSGIPDLAGNRMAKQTFQFAGVAHPSSPVRLSSMQAVNENTIEITFNRSLSDSDVAKLRTAVLTDNGSSVSMSGWPQPYQALKPKSDGKTVTVQFRTGKDANPHLFRPGHLYTARVTGIDNLDVTDNDNVGRFAGTEVDNPAPRVTKVVALDDDTVKVYFSEPVKNVSKEAFKIDKKNGDKGDVNVTGVKGIDKNDVVTEAVLELEPELRDQSYIMTFISDTVTDAAGWNGFQTRDGSKAYAVEFRGV